MGYKINQEIRQSIYIKHLNKKIGIFLSLLAISAETIHTHPPIFKFHSCHITYILVC
ncbi:hypothetical protein HanPI659440_Chr01g0021171 [Helianthus annuus]|nr:hypothetical protein HanPI659440_Chr01g0021171 [Helianthus annuus]